MNQAEPSVKRIKRYQNECFDEEIQVQEHSIWGVDFFCLALSSFFYKRDLLPLSFVSRSLRLNLNHYIALKRSSLKCELAAKAALLPSTVRVTQLRSWVSSTTIQFDMRWVFIEVVRLHFRAQKKLRSGLIKLYMPLMTKLLDYLATYSEPDIRQYVFDNTPLINSLARWLDLLFFNLTIAELGQCNKMIAAVMRITPLYDLGFHYEGRPYIKVVYLFRNQYSYCRVENMMRYSIELLSLNRHFRPTAKLNLSTFEINYLYLFVIHSHSALRQKHAQAFFKTLLENLNQSGLNVFLFNLIRFVGVGFLEQFFDFSERGINILTPKKLSQLFYTSFFETNAYKVANVSRLNQLIHLMCSHGLSLSDGHKQDKSFIQLAIKFKLHNLVQVLLSLEKYNLDQLTGSGDKLRQVLLSDDFSAGLRPQRKRAKFKRWIRKHIKQRDIDDPQRLITTANTLLSLR